MRFRPTLASSGVAFAWAAASLCSWALLVGPSRAAASQLSADEYTLKGAFLYKLAKFVYWPQWKFKQDDSPFIIGVAGQEAFERVSAVVQNKSIDKHDVAVRLIASEDDIKDCHILFVTRSQKQRAIEWVEAAKKASVLTFGETDKFLDSGGMIRFYLDADSLRLEIADDSVRAAGLSIKSTALSSLINKGIARLRKA